MEFLNIKALHIIFVVSWFAGLFYIVRLFIYHIEAEEREPIAKKILQDQYKIMQKRLWYIITWPAAILAIVFGIWMLVLEPAYLKLPWMHLKLSFVFGLLLYQIKCDHILRQLQNDVIKWTSTQLRMWNEIATLFLFSIVFIVVVGKVSLDDWYWGVVGLVIFGVLMMVIVKMYKKSREKNKE
jgi:putative membrane protein